MTSAGSEAAGVFTVKVVVVGFEVEARRWFSFSRVLGTGRDFAIISTVEAQRWKGGLGFGAC